MTQEEALRSPKRSILTQCVGASEELKPDLVSGIVSPKDVFLLCSDGFRHKLSVKEMEMEFNHLHLVSNEQIYEVCEELVNRVVLRGEKDNISAIVIKAE
jgi:serine/threonine protein phosphatase PrpC